MFVSHVIHKYSRYFMICKSIMIIFTYQALETIEEKRKFDNKKNILVS